MQTARAAVGTGERLARIEARIQAELRAMPADQRKDFESKQRASRVFGKTHAGATPRQRRVVELQAQAQKLRTQRSKAVAGRLMNRLGMMVPEAVHGTGVRTTIFAR